MNGLAEASRDAAGQRQMGTGTLRTGAGHHVAGQSDVAGCAALQRDGGQPEVIEHVNDTGEPKVLDSTLPSVCQRETQVLQQTGGTLGSEKYHNGLSAVTERVKYWLLTALNWFLV